MGVSPSQVGSDKYESAYNSLIQHHLLKLELADAIYYDDRGKTVTVQPRLYEYAAIVNFASIILGPGGGGR